MTKNQLLTCLAFCLLPALILATCSTLHAAEASPFVHKAAIDLSGTFGAGKPDGTRPISVTCDGTNAYVGGVTGPVSGGIGIVKIVGVADREAHVVPLPNTRFTPVLGTGGYFSVAYDPGERALVACHDSGEPATSFVRRLDPSDGSVVWNVGNFESDRPSAMSIDPKGVGGKPTVVYLVDASPRARVLSLSTGELLEVPAGSGVVNFWPTPPQFGSIWRSITFDPEGSVFVTSVRAYAYGVRTAGVVDAPDWRRINGAGSGTSTVLVKQKIKQALRGPAAAILDDISGRDLVALSVQDRNVTKIVSRSGQEQQIANTRVLIRNLDGSTDGLATVDLSGDEDGVGQSWTGSGKAIWFGRLEEGGRALLVLDQINPRLDVYELRSR